MKLAGIQQLLVCNPFRIYLQKTFEAPRVCGGVTLARGCSCIEIGCGCGAGALCINQFFDCSRLTCVDSDPDMIASAGRYISHPPQWARSIRTDNIVFACEDATRLPYPEYSFDAAFLFGVLNSILDWPCAVKETFRVLKRGGVFSFKEAIQPGTFFYMSRLFGYVPRITEDELRDGLIAAGFTISLFKVNKLVPACFVRAIKSS